VAGPLGGYFAGEFLVTKFGAPRFVMMIFTAVGFMASVIETVKIIKIASKTKG
jgi:hypothetical protein